MAKLFDYMFIPDIAEIQHKVKDALNNIWKNFMSNDWLYPDDRRTFSVAEFYTDLRWVKMLKGPIHLRKETMASIYDLLTLAGTGNKELFIEGKIVCKRS